MSVRSDDERLEALRKNTIFFPLPPKNFDPLTASEEKLREFGLPPRPNAEQEPERYKFWVRLFSPPLLFLQAEFGFASPLDSIDDRGLRAFAGGHRERSLNWSGGYISANGGQTFIQVNGEYNVPMPSPPTNVDGEYHSSTWIGLDGQKMYFNSSLPQIGTLQNVDVVNGQPTTQISAWWQWWVRDQDNFPVSLPLSVSEDDSILCSLVVVTPTKVKFLIKNQTTGYMIAPFDQVAPMAQMTHMPSPIQVEISGATAEWIMERPTKLQSTQLYELPSYNRVEFKNCLAVSASSGMADRTHDLSNANLINMMAVREHPHRTVPISVAQRQGNNGIVTTP